MPTPLLAYLTCLLPFLLIDAVWLGVMGPRFYRPTLGDMALDGVRWAPAALFYLAYPIGLMVFAVLPALKDPDAPWITGALFGLFCYGTYDLTNHATLRNWTVGFTLVDMTWGAVLSGACAALGWWLTRRFTG